jgi:hypothetical protein
MVSCVCALASLFVFVLFVMAVTVAAAKLHKHADVPYDLWQMLLCLSSSPCNLWGAPLKEQHWWFSMFHGSICVLWQQQCSHLCYAANVQTALCKHCPSHHATCCCCLGMHAEAQLQLCVFYSMLASFACNDDSVAQRESVASQSGLNTGLNPCQALSSVRIRRILHSLRKSQ